MNRCSELFCIEWPTKLILQAFIGDQQSFFQIVSHLGRRCFNSDQTAGRTIKSGDRPSNRGTDHQIAPFWRLIFTAGNISFFLSFAEPCEEVDIDYLGDDINSCGIKTKSWQKCSDECRKYIHCLYWTWLPNEFSEVNKRTQCCLKNAKSGRTNYKGLIPGAKQCGDTRKFP